MVRLRSLAYALRESFWFVPVLLVCGALLLHFLAALLDDAVAEGLALYEGDASGSREILSIIANSIITVAGVVFSVTMVTLSIASSQFGPRLIRSFMRDTGTQIVLGVLLATFVFALLSERRIEGGDDGTIPEASLAIAFVLVLLSIGLLIFFIHHVAASVQAETMVDRLGKELKQAIDRHLSRHDRLVRLDEGEGEAGNAGNEAREEARIASTATGFIKVVNYDRLLKLAVRTDSRVVLLVSAGSFVASGTAIAVVRPPERQNDLASGLGSAFIIGAHRTLEQDVSFGFEELVDVAVRALSPGVNVPFLAALCVDHMSAALSAFGENTSRFIAHADAEGTPRIFVQEPDFVTLLETVYSEVRRHGAGSMPVLEACYKSFGDLLQQVESAAARSAIAEQARRLYEDASQRLQSDSDLLFLASMQRGITQSLER